MDKKILYVILWITFAFGLISGTIFLENYIIKWKENKALQEQYEKTISQSNAEALEEEYYQNIPEEEIPEEATSTMSTSSSSTSTLTTTTSSGTTTTTTPITEVPF